MKTYILLLGKVHKIFQKWTTEFLGRLGNTLSDTKGEYKFLRPVHAVILADNNSYNTIVDKFGFERQVALIGYDAYQRIRRMSDSDIESHYRAQEKAEKDLSVAFWLRPHHKYRGLVPIDLDRDEGYIFAAVERVESLAQKIEKSFNENVKGGTLRAIFKIVLLHEFCHHATLINLSRKHTLFVKENEDENFTEGLANTILHYLLSNQERRLLAELVAHQSIPYRYYYALRNAGIGGVLDALMNQRDILGSLREFAGLIGGRVVLNGNILRVRTKADGWFMGWSDRGGTIVAGERIEFLGPFDKGYFITSKITHLVGRFPSGAKVYANEIEHIYDYTKLPANVRIVPKEKCDLERLVKNFTWNTRKEELPNDIVALVNKIEGLS